LAAVAAGDPQVVLVVVVAEVAVSVGKIILP
jgi:hypothetical protein